MKIKKTFFISLLLIQTFIFVSFVVPTKVLAAEGQSFTDKIGSFFNDAKNKAVQTYLKVMPGEKDGELVLKQAIQASTELQEAKMDLSLKSDLIQSREQVGNFNFALTGPVNFSSDIQSENIKQALDFSGELSLEGTSFKFDVNFKMDGRTIYVKINQLPAVPLLDMTKLKDQWLRFENKAMDSNQEKTELTKDQEQELIKLTEEFIQQAEVSPAEKTEIRDQKVFKLIISFEQADIIDYLLKVNQLINQGDDKAEPLKREDLEEAFNYLEVPEITVGINRSNFYFTYLGLSTEFDLEEALEDQAKSLPPASQQQMAGLNALMTADKMDLALEIYLADFNQEVKFEIPAEFENGQEKIQEAFTPNSMMPGGFQNPGEGSKQPIPGQPVVPDGYELSPEEMQRIKQLQQQYQQ